MKYAKSILSLLLVPAMLVGLCPTVLAAALPFGDVAADSWYRDSVEYVWENGLMSGTSPTDFGPDLVMTRAMLVTVLYRLSGSPEDFTVSPFVDVPLNAYYYKPVVWAFKNGIVSGTGAHVFSPDADITREQLVAIFSRYAAYKGYDTASDIDLIGYADYNTVSLYAREPFRWAVGAGIVSGTTPVTLSPQGTATRAQCATILSRFAEWTERAVVPATPIITGLPTPTFLPKPTLWPTVQPTFIPKPSVIPVPTSVPTPTAVPMATPTPTPEPTPVVPAEGTLLSESQDYSALGVLPKNPVQDILYYTNHGVTVDGNPGADYCKYKSLSTDTVEAYIAMLEQNGFTLNDYFHESYMSGSSYYSWGLLYDLDPDIETIDQMFAKKQCHLCIYKSRSSYGSTTYRINWSPDLNLCDMGLRIDGSTVPITPAGESVAAGLLKLSDGSYKTDDGRLSVTPGTATVIRDGEPLTGTVTFEITKKGKDVLTIGGYAEDEQIVFTADEGYVHQNAIYRNYEIEELDEIALSATIDGETRSCGRNSTAFAAVSVRPMYYEQDGDAVYYIYIKTMGHSPTELEILCSVSTAPPPEIPFPDYDESQLVKVNGNSSKTITITTDQILEIEYTNREWDSMYHVFEWEITQGAELLLMDEGYDSAKFAPMGVGTAEVKLDYSYTKKQPDVLTGIIRDWATGKVSTYTIVISEP